MTALDLCELRAQPPLLSLGKTALLVFHGAGVDSESKTNRKFINQSSSRVVQVTIDVAEDAKAVRNFDMIAAFFLVQHEISNLVISVLRAHFSHPLTTPIRFVESEGSTPYTLTAESKPWTFGKTLSLMWGDERILPSAVKWTFKFAVA